jgi:hypothetical protein
MDEPDAHPFGNELRLSADNSFEERQSGILISSGYGIRKGASLPRVSNLDVAPTLSRLLQIDSPGNEGRVLEEFLEPAR